MEIIWRQAALNDLEAIRELIAQDNPRAAARVRTAIREAAERLAAYPNLGRAGRVEGTRELVIPDTPYIASATNCASARSFTPRGNGRGAFNAVARVTEPAPPMYRSICSPDL